MRFVAPIVAFLLIACTLSVEAKCKKSARAEVVKCPNIITECTDNLCKDECGPNLRCTGGKICCAQGSCGNKCEYESPYDPPYGKPATKFACPLKCPSADSIDCYGQYCEDECNDSRGCDIGLVCCESYCGNKCVPRVHSPPYGTEANGLSCIYYADDE